MAPTIALQHFHFSEVLGLGNGLKVNVWLYIVINQFLRQTLKNDINTVLYEHRSICVQATTISF